MAKIEAPLFSLDATGTLDKNITYKKKLRDNIAQKYSQPGAKNPFESSPRQKDQRSIIRLITIHWQCMSSGDKLAWETAAKDVRFKGTGYHYFLHMAQQNLTQYLGLAGYWSMNYNIDDKIPDLSGNGNHGTLSPIYPCDYPTLVDSIDKKHGKATKYNGTTNYISLPVDLVPVSRIRSSGVTYSAFIKPYDTTKKQRLFGQAIGFGHSDYSSGGLGIESSSKAVFLTYDSWGAYRYVYSSQLLNNNQFYFLTGTYNPVDKHIRLYINGIESGTPVNVYTYSLLSPNLANSIGIMRPDIPLFFYGLIDEVSIYEKLLSPDLIYRLFSL